MRGCTLRIILDEKAGNIILAMKKRGFGAERMDSADGEVDAWE